MRALLDLYRRVIPSQFLQGVVETFSTRVVLIGVGLVTSVIVARTLGPEGRGSYAVVVNLSAVGVQLGNLGLPASNTYLVAGKRDRLSALLGNSLLASHGFGSLIAMMLGVVLTMWPHLVPVSGWALWLALLWIPFGLGYSLVRQLLLGIQDVGAYNGLELIVELMAVALTGLVILSGFVSPEVVFGARFAALACGFGLALWRVRPHLGRIPLPSWRLLQEGVGYGLRAYLSTLASFLLLRVNVFMVARIAGTEQVGYYSIAVSMANTVYMLPTVIGTILFPQLSAMRTDEERQRMAWRTAAHTAVLMLALAAGIGAIAKPAIHLLYGRTFLPAFAAFVWLLPAIVLLSVNTIFMNYHAAMGMPMIAIYVPSVAALLNVLLSARLIASMGIVGASVSSVIVYGAMVTTNILYVWRDGRQGRLQHD